MAWEFESPQGHTTNEQMIPIDLIQVLPMDDYPPCIIFYYDHLQFCKSCNCDTMHNHIYTNGERIMDCLICGTPVDQTTLKSKFDRLKDK